MGRKQTASYTVATKPLVLGSIPRACKVVLGVSVSPKVQLRR